MHLTYSSFILSSYIFQLFAEEQEKGGSSKKGGVEENSVMVADFNLTMPGE